MKVIEKNQSVVVLGFVLLWAFIWPSVLLAEVPQQINYQGYLTDASGNPIDGDYQMIFSIYNVSTEGTELWSEEQTVPVTDGIYNVQIGQDPNGNSFPDNLFDYQRWLGVTVGADDEMTPRQPLTSVPYAMQAGGTSAGAVTSVMLADEAVTTEKVAVAAITADKIVGGTGSGVDADQLDGHDTAYFATATDVAALQGQVLALAMQVDQLQVLLAGVIRNGNDITFSGVNVRIVNGTGSTDGTTNDLGNLIVGYNELRASDNVRTGSHNIVAGMQNNYSSYGGLVAGNHNTISDAHATVSGGFGNTASGVLSSISGGYNNTTIGSYSSISGGIRNSAEGNVASVSGGDYNTASGEYSSISGGRYNTARGQYSSVAGGGGEEAVYGNLAYSNYSAILGGGKNKTGDPDLEDPTVGERATVSGGYVNKAYGENASVSGGMANHAREDASSVSGGFSNNATGVGASVVGGAYNIASGGNSTVTGGFWNYTEDHHSSVSGGAYNIAEGNSSSVSGGNNNTTSGEYSSISGGNQNTASGEYSSVSGGSLNSAFSNYSAILGGRGNYAGDDSNPDDHTIGVQSTVSGGYKNYAIGHYSSVSGGTLNVADGKISSVLGGEHNLASGEKYTNVGDTGRVFYDNLPAH